MQGQVSMPAAAALAVQSLGLNFQSVELGAQLRRLSRARAGEGLVEESEKMLVADIALFRPHRG